MTVAGAFANFSVSLLSVVCFNILRVLQDFWKLLGLLIWQCKYIFVRYSCSGITALWAWWEELKSVKRIKKYSEIKLRSIWWEICITSNSRRKVVVVPQARRTWHWSGMRESVPWWRLNSLMASQTLTGILVLPSDNAKNKLW